jgi:GNAT superfamily N-acetyltransferase
MNDGSDPLKITVRMAHEGDGPGIANVHLNSWRETYSGLLPEDYLATMPLTFKNRMKSWNQLIDKQPQGRGIWVAENDRHGIVGFSTVELARDEKFKDLGELGAIYLLKHYQGAGVGFSLLRAAFSFLRTAGFTKAYCWVLKDNPTISFYEKSGGKIADDVKVDKIGQVELVELACIWEDLSRF